MHLRPRSALPLLLCFCLVPALGHAQERVAIDLETGAAFTGYNDVRIPGNTGTLFSLTDDLRSKTAYFWRGRLDYRVSHKNVLSVLAAPLEVTATGAIDRPVFFVDRTFPGGTPLTATYVFNSYRVTWRYELVQNERWRFGLGVTMKVRDAVTRLEGGGQRAEKTDLGVVPLVNFKLERALGSRATFRLEGDALAAPQGRAEDVFVGLVFPVSRSVSIKAGYRLLEGGADVDEVYTFTAVHYAAVGAIVRF
jgi:hypothetical protein